MNAEARPRIRRRADRVMRELPMLRNSERATFKRCRFLWDIGYNRQLAPRTASPPLRFGTIVHSALAAYYTKGVKRGKNPVTEFERLYEIDLKESEAFGWRNDEGRWFNAGELGVAMLTNYLNTYGKDEEWEVLVTEHPYRMMVPHPVKASPWFIQTGVLDGVWRHRSKKDHTVIVDHKTAASINTRYLAMDDQAGSYWTWGVDYLHAHKLLDPRLKLNGMMFNYLRKTMPDERQTNELGQRLNQNGSISKRQPAPYFERHYTWRDEFDRGMQRERAWDEYKEIELVRAGELGVTKSPGQLTCNGCWLLDACELHETGNDWEEFLKQTTKSWDPYAEHEIMMGR